MSFAPPVSFQVSVSIPPPFLLRRGGCSSSLRSPPPFLSSPCHHPRIFLGQKQKVKRNFVIKRCFLFYFPTPRSVLSQKLPPFFYCVYTNLYTVDPKLFLAKLEKQIYTLFYAKLKFFTQKGEICPGIRRIIQQ